MKQLIKLASTLILCVPGALIAAPAGFDAATLFSDRVDQFCASPQLIDADTCKSLVHGAFASVQGDSVDWNGIGDRIKQETIKKPEFWNSALAKEFGKEIPLGLKFESIDANDGDTVIGVSYSIEKNLTRKSLSPSERRKRYFEVDFTGSGTVVQNEEVNPRDFLDTKLTIAARYTSRIPPQDDAFGLKLTDYAVASAQCSDPPDEACIKARREGFAMFDGTVAFLRAFSTARFGLDAGYESNQSFTVTQRKLSGFVYAQMESWGTGSMLGMLNPALRVAVDQIKPGNETPRAIAGDDSDYYRASAELSLWFPIGDAGGAPLVLTANFRHYREIGASDLVKDANLDAYTLRSFTLSGSDGLFISYSSGRLPFGLANDDVLALGWSTHF